MTNTEQNPELLRVALIASDDALRSAVRLLLTVSGMTVDEYRTARQLLAAASASYACLIVDCRLADMPGHRLCMEIIRHNHELPIVVLAADPEAFEFVRTARPGIRVVSKPFAGELLIDSIMRSTADAPDHGDDNRVRPAALPATS